MLPFVAEGPRRHSSFRLRLLLATTSLVLALGAAEAYLHIMKPLGTEFALDATNGQLPPGLFRDDDELKVTLAPETTVDAHSSGHAVEVRTNALGLRGAALGPKAAGELRVLAIGDSFTLGMQVEEAATFSAILSSRLTAQLHRQVSVLNAGVPGYGTDQARLWMNRLVSRTQADAVLLTLYTGNDLRDNARWSERQARPRAPSPGQPGPPQRGAVWRELANYSRIAAYLQLMSNLDALAKDFRIQEYRDEILPFANSAHLSGLLPATTAALTRFNEACRAQGVPCIIAIAPPAYVVHPERVQRTFEAFGLDPQTAQLDAPGKRIRSAVPPGIPVVDLTAALRGESDLDPYMIWDPHWSTSGHRIAADAMAPLLKSQLEALP